MFQKKLPPVLHLSVEKYSCVPGGVGVAGVSGVLSHSHRGIFQNFVDDFVDIACCGLDWAIAFAQSLASFNFFTTSPPTPFVNCDDLLLQGEACIQLYLRWVTGDSYTGGFFRPVTDDYIDTLFCWITLAKDAARDVMNSILFGFPTLDTQLDGLVLQFSACLCTTLKFITLSSVTNIFTDVVDDFCPVMDCWLQLGLRLFRSFRDLNFVTDSLGLLIDFCACVRLYLLWLWNSTGPGSFFVPFVETLIDLFCELLVLLFRLVHDTLLTGTLSGDIGTRITDLVSLVGNFLDAITGGMSFGTSIIDPIPVDAAAVFGNFLTAWFQLTTSLIGGTFLVDLNMNLTQFFAAWLSLLNLVTDNTWAYHAMPSFTALAQCGTLAFKDLLVASEPGGSPSFKADLYLIQACQCMDDFLFMIFPTVNPFGVIIRQFVTCQCVFLRQVLAQIAALTLWKNDCHFCSHPTVPGGSCAGCHDLLGFYCDCWSVLFQRLFGIGNLIPNAAGAVESITDLGCCFVSLSKPALGAILSTLNGDAPETLNQFTTWTTDLFGCMDDVLNALSGGLISNFLLWLANLLVGFIPGLNDLLAILNCFLSPVPNFWQRILHFGGVLDGSTGQPIKPVLPDITTGDLLGSCQMASTLVLPIVQCLNNPLISILGPFQGVSGVLFATDPTQSPFVMMASKFDMVMQCPCEFWLDVASGGATCDSSCVSCVGGLTAGDTDWSIIPNLFKILPNPPFDPSIFPSLTAITELNFNPTIICCLPSLFTCLANTQALGVHGPISGMFNEVGQVMNEIFTVALNLVCSIIHFVAFFTELFRKLFALLDAFGDVFNVLQKLVNALRNILGLALAELNKLKSAFGALKKTVDLLIKSIGTISKTLNLVVQTIKIFDDFFDNIESMCEDIKIAKCDLFKTRSITPRGLMKISSVCPFYEDADMWETTASQLQDPGSREMKQLRLCSCSMANIKINSSTMQPITSTVLLANASSSNTALHLWMVDEADTYMTECLREVGRMAPGTRIELSEMMECVWRLGLENTRIYNDYPMGRCLYMMHLVSPMGMYNVTRHNQVALVRMREYEICYKAAVFEEAGRRQKELDPDWTHVPTKMLDKPDIFNLFAYTMAPFIAGVQLGLDAIVTNNPIPPTPYTLEMCIDLQQPLCALEPTCLRENCTTCTGSPELCIVDGSCRTGPCSMTCLGEGTCLIPRECQANISTCTTHNARRGVRPLDPAEVIQSVSGPMKAVLDQITDNLSKNSSETHQILESIGKSAKNIYENMEYPKKRKSGFSKERLRYNRWKASLNSKYHTKQRQYEIWVDAARNFSRDAARQPELFEQAYPRSSWAQGILVEATEALEGGGDIMDLSEEQRIAIVVDRFVRTRYRKQFQRTADDRVRMRDYKMRQRRLIEETVLGFESTREARKESLVQWLEEQKRQFQRSRTARDTSFAKNPVLNPREDWSSRTPVLYGPDHWFTATELDRIYSYSNMSLAADARRVFWVQDTEGHYGYAYFEEGDSYLQKLRGAQNDTLSIGAVPEEFLRDHHARYPSSKNLLPDQHMQHRRARSIPVSEGSVLGGDIETRTPGFVLRAQRGWELYNMSHHLGVLSNFSRSLRNLIPWRDVAGSWAQGSSTYEMDTEQKHSIFLMRVNKQSWKQGIASVFGSRKRNHMSPPMRPLRRENRAILPTTTNKSPFNANEWLINLFDDMVRIISGGKENVISGAIADLQAVPIEEDIRSLVESIVDYAVCSRPQDYNSTYKISCFPNVPRGALDWISPVPTDNFPRQMWDRIPNMAKQGSCVNLIARPTDNCGVLDGGNRPDCILPAPFTCDWCEQSFHDCVADIGFEDVGDAIAFSIAALPRTFNILTHPRQEMGLVGRPEVAIPVAIMFPNAAVFVINLVVGGTLTMTPIVNMIFPGAWKFTTAMYVGTLLFDFPTVEWDILGSILPLVQDAKAVSDPWQIMTWAESKIKRHDHPNSWRSLPARDTTCYTFTFANLTFPWAIFLLLVMILFKPFTELLEGFSRFLARLANIGMHMISFWMHGRTDVDITKLERSVLQNQADIEYQDEKREELEAKITAVNLSEGQQEPSSSSSTNLRRRRLD